MRTLYFDCFSGISGDMIVGALCDLGVKPSSFEWELSKLNIGDFHMHFDRRARRGIEGVKFGIHEGATHTHGQDEEKKAHHHHEHEHEHAHGHSHDHGQHEHHEHAEGCCHEHGHGHEHGHEEQGHAHECCGHRQQEKHEHEHAHGRSFADIRALIEESDLSEFVKTHALGVFRRLAAAEGRIHGQPLDEVAFHEVGALDSIADIVCACAGLEALNVEQVLVSPLNDGRGWVRCAHGQFPIPSPATLQVLAGIPLGQIDEPFELITPTGAAIVAEFGRSFGAMPELRIEKIGYGVGDRDLPTRPNVLRAVLGETTEAAPAGYLTDTVVCIETNLDDVSPEIVGAVVGNLFDAGALDAFLTPVQMKKNRPGVQLTVLCEDTAVSRMADLIFSETTSFGIRMSRTDRWKLDRRFEVASTEGCEVVIKVGLRAGEPIQAAPEFESCKAAAEKSGRPLRAVYESAMMAYHERLTSPISEEDLRSR